MARKKVSPEPEPQVEPLDAPEPKKVKTWKGKRPVQFTEGEFSYMGKDGLRKAKFRAVFENDTEEELQADSALAKCHDLMDRQTQTE